MSNVYAEMGFLSRKGYLSNLADEFGVDVETVMALASVLGPNEDFDGLVTALEDAYCGSSD